MSEKEPEIKRWTAKRKLAMVMDIIKGKATAVEVAREHGLTVSEVEGWRERFMDGAEEFLRSNPRDEHARHYGELTLAVDALKKTQRSQGILPPRERMSALVSIFQTEGREIGRSWLCRLLGIPPQHGLLPAQAPAGRGAGRRGPGRADTRRHRRRARLRHPQRLGLASPRRRREGQRQEDGQDS